ncbi:MAG: acyl carrier protein [Candidatus Woykebacteria bacterium]
MNTLEEIKELISGQFGVEKDSILPDSHLQDDLNADPLSIADLVVSLEDKFKLKIPQEEIIKFNKVSDIVEFIEDQMD